MPRGESRRSEDRGILRAKRAENDKSSALKLNPDVYRAACLRLDPRYDANCVRAVRPRGFGFVGPLQDYPTMRQGVAPDRDFGCRLRFHRRSFSPASLAADALIQLEDARRLKKAKCDSRGLSPFDAACRWSAGPPFRLRDETHRANREAACWFDNTHNTLLHGFPAVQLFG